MQSLFRRPDESFLLFSLLLSGHPNFNMHGLVVFDKAMTNSNPKKKVMNDKIHLNTSLLLFSLRD